jgi:hypothetical protein
MPAKKKADAKSAPTFIDSRTNEDYSGCGALIGPDQSCHRFAGHDGSHRPYLYKLDDPEVAEKRAKRAERAAAWNVLTPEQQEAVKAERKASWLAQQAKWAAEKAAEKAPALAATARKGRPAGQRSTVKTAAKAPAKPAAKRPSRKAATSQQVSA